MESTVSKVLFLKIEVDPATAAKLSIDRKMVDASFRD